MADSLLPIVGPLAGAIVGGLIGFGANSLLRRSDYRRHDQAVREQIVVLFRAIEKLMLQVVDDAGTPLERWRAIDTLVDRIFSNDAATALSQRSVRLTIYEAVFTLQQIREGLDQTGGALTDVIDSMKGGEYQQTGPPKIEGLKNKRRRYGEWALQVIQQARHELGDDEKIPPLAKTTDDKTES